MVIRLRLGLSYVRCRIRVRVKSLVWMVRVGWGMPCVYESPHRSTVMYVDVCVRFGSVCWVFLGSFDWKPGRNNQPCAASQGSFKTSEETELLKGMFWKILNILPQSSHLPTCQKLFQQFLVWTRDAKIYLKRRFSLSIDHSQWRIPWIRHTLFLHF